MGHAGLAHDEGPARVDVLHQVVALHLERLGAGDVDRARVVHADVDAAEAIDGLGHRVLDRLLVADVAGDGQGGTAGLLDLRGGRVDCALELRVRLGGLGDQRDVGAVARRPQGDRETDPAAAAAHEDRLVRERRHGRSG